MRRLTLFLIGYLLLFTQPIVQAEVTLPHVIGSNMVLQRDMEVPIWGWASAGEEITITLSTEDEEADPLFTTTVVADAEGNWQVKMSAMQAGGPYILRVYGLGNPAPTIELTNVLFGEVWVCSGQSNMQWSVSASKDSEAEIAAADYPNIRLFYVPRVPSGLLQNDVEADWSETTLRQSRIFPLSLTISDGNSIKILISPSDLINTSWGGTRIEPWTPPAGFCQCPHP